MSDRDGKRRGPRDSEIDDIVERKAVVYVPVQACKREGDGAVLVCCTAPSGMWQYFWINRQELHLTAA